MRSIIVGLINENKVYYDLDAKPGERDAIIERPDGTSIKANIVQLSSTARNFTKLRSTPFQRFLWDAPRNATSGAWYETFITKTRPVNDSLLSGMPEHSVLGKNKKKIDKANRAAKSFIDADIEKHMLTKSCCDGMIKLNTNSFSFKTAEDRDFAWKAISLLRTTEETNGVY